MTGGAKGWAAEIDAEFAAMMADAVQEVADLAQIGVNLLVDRSPVKSGLFKGNWQVSFGEPVAGLLAVTDKDGTETKARVAAALAEYASNGKPLTIVIHNNTAYGEELEAGKSDQAPQGLLALTAAELAAIWEAKS